ncbi:MAG: aminopeptidase P N-terminal domain-containing protein, partial [Acidobacteriota bacterium]
PAAPKFTDAERHTELERRRAAVAAKMADNSIMVLFSAEPRLYTNDVDYVYRQENNFYYLTGLKQQNATLVLTKSAGTVTQTLFLPKRNPLREAWEGKMYSREQATQVSGLTQIVDASEKDTFIEAVKSRGKFTSKDGKVSINGAPTLYLLLPEGEQDNNGRREFRVEHEMSKALTEYKVENAQPIFSGLRHIKSPYELKMLQHAIDITTEAQLRSMAMVGRAQWEYEVHAEVEYTFRRRNADFWGYPSIVGCGSNATTLHYVESQSPIKKGELLLMDVGAEYEHYTADVTRTFPVNGKFTKEQAEIYQIVYDAQEAVAKATKPGVTFGQLSQIARTTINDGLFKLGLVADKSSRQAGIWSF